MEDKVLSEYFELLRYESVGADPSHLRDCVSCASWLRKWLGALGFSAELVYPRQEPGGALPPPAVFAERKGGEAAATVLVYGHYDVQPADPVSEWDTPPFEPTMKDGRVYCRGANDDKGQTFALLCGMRDYLAAEGPKLNIKIVLDGQEESGSGALMALAPEMRRRLAADVLLVCDTSAAPSMRPAIVAGLRGVAHFTLRLTGPNRDLHSGEYGGIAPNPAQGMAELLASLHHPDGSIAVAGFRDGIEPPTHEETSAAEASTPSEEECAADIGCETAGGQMGKTIAQRVSFEPTIEVNGIHAGYGGPGAKTVIPCEAVAKISMRLVPGQSPRGAFAAVLRGCQPRDARVQASARLARLPPCVACAVRDGRPRRAVPVGRRIDPRAVGTARGVRRRAARRRMGSGAGQDTLPERELLRRAVRQGARMGKAHLGGARLRWASLQRYAS